ncbi:hypothetical protein [Selenomonas sp. AB3002]|uniref:hypothetical protein n=1 Tax=Selenomonas sp. AB3002 TaxID=1392502 RepID=UPI000497FC88
MLLNIMQAKRITQAKTSDLISIISVCAKRQGIAKERNDSKKEQFYREMVNLADFELRKRLDFMRG